MTHLNPIIVIRFVFFVLVVGTASSGFAQRKGEPAITKEQMNQINQIIQPVKAITDEILAKDRTGTYARYQKEVQVLGETKNVEQRKALTQKILSTYQSFFANVWKEAGVDERSYQVKIREVFPVNMRETIQFGSYLGFSMVTPPTSEPAPAPPPANTCVDVCSIAKGSLNGSNYLISGGGGNYGNCYANANAWGAVAAFGEISSNLKNNITIPGTFVDDARRLAISISYDMKIEGTAFAVFGCSMASATVGNGWTRQYMMLFSPVIFATHRLEQSTVQENFIVEKKAIGNYNVNAGSSVLTAAISGSWGTAEANNIRWTVCETK